MTFSTLFQTPPPDVAIEIDHAHVGAARLEWRGSQAVIAAHAHEALPAGMVVPSLSALNLADVPAVARVVGRVLAQVGQKTSRVALIVPDTVAKVSLLRLEKVPAKAADLQEIVRWQVRKTAPFPIEQAILSISPGVTAADGSNEMLVSLARADVIQQYEQACRMAGADAGLVDIASFSVINAILAAPGRPTGDWLLVHITDTYLTLAVMREQALLFFRHRGGRGDAGGFDPPDRHVLRRSPARRRLCPRADCRWRAPAWRRRDGATGPRRAAARRRGIRRPAAGRDPG